MLEAFLGFHLGFRAFKSSGFLALGFRGFGVWGFRFSGFKGFSPFKVLACRA